MTDLKCKVKRRTVSHHRGRRIIVSLIPGDVLSFREERRRGEYLLSIGGAYDYAVMLEVERRKAARIAARKANRR